jgi:tight adherence protein C
LQQAEGLGTPVADTMERIAGDMREEFRQAVRRRAARAAPRVSLIVTLIIVPGAVVLIMTALFLGVGVDAGSLGG